MCEPAAQLFLSAEDFSARRELTGPRIWRLAVLVGPLVAAACSAATTAAPSQAAASAGPSAAEIEAIYRARSDSARMRFTVADVRFMTGMIHHHAQAVQVARLAAGHGASASVQTLAARIINGQLDEIATMQEWLRDRGQPVPELHISDTQVMVHDAERSNHRHMPGMLSTDQLRQLEQARGPAFDRLFLAFMIEHHRGAVAMVHELFSTDGAGQDEAVFKLASDVQVDQSTEVARMELMLAALPPGDRSP